VTIKGGISGSSSNSGGGGGSSEFLVGLYGTQQTGFAVRERRTLQYQQWTHQSRLH